MASSTAATTTAGSEDCSRLLVLGDADFSYSYDLVRYLSVQQSTSEVTATGLDELDGALAKYGDLGNTLAKLAHANTSVLSKSQLKKRKRNSSLPKPVPVRVLHGVNALHPPSSLPPTFDTIIFNHPHLGTESFPKHRRFLSHLFAALLPLSTPTTTLHLTFASPEQTSRWAALTRSSRHWKPVDRRSFCPPPTSHKELSSTGGSRYITWRKGQSGRGFKAGGDRGGSEAITYVRRGEDEKQWAGDDDAQLVSDEHALPWMVEAEAEKKKKKLSEWKCPGCDKEFSAEKSLAQHFADSASCARAVFGGEEEGKICEACKCEDCGRNFVSEYALQLHRAEKHMGTIDKPLWFTKSREEGGWVDERETDGATAAAAAATDAGEGCGICGVRYTAEFSKEDHEKEFVIEEDNNARDWECKVCGKKFREKRGMQQHANVKCAKEGDKQN
jgi:transposase-like protein